MNSPPKYNMSTNPVYAIDMSTANSGKRLAATKRRVRFRFGFSNPKALANGLTGNECRGEEHEVNLVWSLTSGKRLIVMDGKEVHFSMGRRGDAKFEVSWPMFGAHTLKVVAHASQPMTATPGFKQFDLLLDGMSFHSMPRIYELGLRGNQPARAVQFSYNNYPAEEVDSGHFGTIRRHEEAHHMNSSYSSIQQQQPPVSHGFAGSVRRTTPDVMPQPAPAPVVAAPAVPPQDVLSESVYARSSDLLATPTTAPVHDEFTPVPVQPKVHTFQDVSNQILSAYGPPHAAPPAPTVPVLANESHTYYAPQAVQTPPPKQHYSPGAPHYNHQGHTPNYGSQAQMVVSPDTVAANLYQPATPTQKHNPASTAPVFTPTMMEPLDLDELRDSPPPVDVMDQAVHNLVNLNDLKETRATPEQLKAKKQKELVKAQEHKSRPKPPAARGYMGADASLADIAQKKPPVAPPTKEIMKVHAFDPAAAQAGMMVVYGQQPPQQGGIPPSTGFGAGLPTYIHTPAY